MWCVYDFYNNQPNRALNMLGWRWKTNMPVWLPVYTYTLIHVYIIQDDQDMNRQLKFCQVIDYCSGHLYKCCSASQAHLNTWLTGCQILFTRGTWIFCTVTNVVQSGIRIETFQKGLITGKIAWYFRAGCFVLLTLIVI